MSDVELGGVIKRFENFEPFQMMQVKILELSPNWRKARLLLPLTNVGMNYQGTMFGGFIASLADPIAAFACGKIWPNYAAWTRKLNIDFIRAGTTNLELRFEFPHELEATIEKELKEKNRSTQKFEYAFYLENGSVCAAVECVVALRPIGYRKKD